MTDRAEVLIVGAGIVGAACAAACAREGLRVTVVEGDLAPGMGATGAGMGHLVVMDDSEAQFALTSVSARLWSALAPSLPDDCEAARCGTVWVAADEEELDAAAAKERYYRARGREARVLDARGLYALEPNLRPGLTGGLLVPDDALLYPPRAAAALLDRAVAAGARVVYGRRAVALGDGGVHLGDATVARAERVVVASGASVSELLPELSVRPRKGHLAITERYPGVVRHQVVELGYLKSAHGAERESVAFNVQPRPTGQLLIGSSRQYDVADAAVDAAIARRMLARAAAYIPALRGLDALRLWAGHRAATPDGLPYVGPCPGREGVIVAAGHEGLGITTSTGTAELVVDHLLGRRGELDPAPYLPSRARIGAARA